MARRIRWAFLVVLVAVVALVGFTGYQALKAKTALEQTAADLESLSGQLTSGDQTAARQTLADAQRHAADARGSTSGPGWWLSARLPQIGPNVRAVRTVAEVTDDVTSGVLPDVVTAAGSLRPDRLQPVKGRVQLGPIQDVTPEVTRAAARLAVQADRIDAIDASSLSPQIARPVGQMQDKIDSADALADRASRAVRLLPAMLGAHGKRTYLFVFQNNAEIRSTGGIPGSFATITADHGRLSLKKQGDASTFGRFAKPPVRVTGQEKALFGRGLGTFPQDVTFTPDYPRSAQIVAGMWRASQGQRVDGVISVDPVALSYVLRGTGPVKTVGGIRLDAGNAVRLLLSQVYADIPVPSQQNVFFDAVARDAFHAVTTGTQNPRELLSGLVQSADERRILVWSEHPDEQRILEPTALSGALARRAGTRPDVGAFQNAALPYKLDYYATTRTTVTPTSCRGDRQVLTMTTTVTSHVPRRYRRLTSYVAPKVPLFGKGTVANTIFFVAPIGGSFDRLELDGQRQQTLAAKRLDGRLVLPQTVTVRPGGSSTVTVRMTTGKGQVGTPRLRVTPGARTSGMGKVNPSACS